MTRRRLVILGVVWTAPSLVLVAAAALTHACYRIDEPTRADAATRADAIAVVRAALEGAPAPAPSPRLARGLSDGGPIVAVAFLDGREVGRGTGRGSTWQEALATAGAGLAASPIGARTPEDKARARIRIDVVVGRGPIEGPSLGVPGISDLWAFNPGLEGLVARVEGREVVMLPLDLVNSSEKLMVRRRPVRVAPDLLLTAIDRKVVDGVLARAGGAAPGTLATDLARIRTDAFVERREADRAQGPLPLYRNNTPPPPMTAASLRAAALEGGRYLVEHISPSGRYIYSHHLATGVESDPTPGRSEYSLPRHSGTTYFLAELYRLTKEEFLREPIERAFAHLVELIRAGGCEGTLPDGTPFACVVDQGAWRTDLGSNALSVVALAEYQRATGDRRYEDLAIRLTNWLMHMQRPDGTFRYFYDARNKKIVDEHKFALYYAGETALAFARMTEVTGDLKYVTAAGKALRATVSQYDTFLGGFYYGEEHWQCIASEAAFPHVKDPELRDFCHGYGAFLRRQQFAPGDIPDQDDIAGSYNLSPMVAPSNTPAGSRTEAMLSAYYLGVKHGTPDPEVKAQILAALRYTLGQVVTPENDYAAAGTRRVLGAMPGSPIDRNVRIDYVQHVCSSMIRAVPLLE